MILVAESSSSNDFVRSKSSIQFNIIIFAAWFNGFFLNRIIFWVAFNLSIFSSIENYFILWKDSLNKMNTVFIWHTCTMNNEISERRDSTKSISYRYGFQKTKITCVHIRITTKQTEWNNFQSIIIIENQLSYSFYAYWIYLKN